MSDVMHRNLRSNKVRIVFTASCAALAIATALLTPGKLRRWIHESSMQHVRSAHYEILFPASAISPEAMTQFAADREPVFATLDHKLGATPSKRFTLVFDSNSSTGAAAASTPAYTVEGTTIRTNLAATPNGNVPRLDPAADAQAMLYAAWGKPGNAQVAYWTSLALEGEWQGQELGMAAAQVEQRVGYKNVSALLSQPPAGQQATRQGGQRVDAMAQMHTMTPQDRDLLAAAWIDQVAELSGPKQVHKLYSTLSKLDLASVSAALGATRPELEREWQLWLFANVAGMPGGGHQMTMQMPAPAP